MSTADRYFRVYPDHVQFADQWFLASPRALNGEEIDSREFIVGLPYKGAKPISVPIRQSGKEVVCAISAFYMPIVSTAVGDTIRRIAPGAAEFYPVTVEGAKNHYEIMNVLCLDDCLDESQSEFTMWSEEDGRPERLGRYSMISVMRLDPARAAGNHIFRLARWPLALLVSETLKSAIEDYPNLGVVFEPVS